MSGGGAPRLRRVAAGRPHRRVAERGGPSAGEGAARTILPRVPGRSAGDCRRVAPVPGPHPPAQLLGRGHRSGVGGPSCSCIGFVDSDHGPLIGKTADWQVDHAQDLTTWQHYRPWRGEGYRFIHYGGAGTWWSEGGLNEAGLGMVLNGLPGEGAAPDSVPTLPLARGVLQHCASVEESIEWLARYDVMYLGFNLMLADRSGDLACVEWCPAPRVSGAPRETGSSTPTTVCSRETEDVTLDEADARGLRVPGARAQQRGTLRNPGKHRATGAAHARGHGGAAARSLLPGGGHQPERRAGDAYCLRDDRRAGAGQALGRGGLSARGALRRVRGLKEGGASAFPEHRIPAAVERMGVASLPLGRGRAGLASRQIPRPGKVDLTALTAVHRPSRRGPTRRGPASLLDGTSSPYTSGARR